MIRLSVSWLAETRPLNRIGANPRLPQDYRGARRHLRSNIAAEARAKIVYERLINFTDDAGTTDALQFLMTREITHMKAFAAALESLGKPRFEIGRIPPTPGLVESPAFSELGRQTGSAGGTVDTRTTSIAGDPDMAEELLVEQLQDLLHAEGQLIKALPTMIKAANAEALKLAFTNHLDETHVHVERLKEAFTLLVGRGRDGHHLLTQVARELLGQSRTGATRSSVTRTAQDTTTKKSRSKQK